MNKAEILTIVMNSPVLEVARETGFDPIELAKFFFNLENLLKRHVPYGEIGDKFYFLLALTVEESDEELNIFEADIFVQKIKDGLLEKGNILFINSNGKLIKQGQQGLISDLVQAADFSRNNNLIAIFIEYTSVYIFVDGMPKVYISDILEYFHPGMKTPKTLPAREYCKLIDRHYDEAVRGEKGVKYWKNKAQRILRDNPEVIFHVSLWLYLKQYMPDGTPDEEATISGTADKTDVRITDWTNKTRYIIEMKCLGRTSLKNSEESDDWANVGLSQINQCLGGEDESCSAGTLVLYDGRREDKGIIWDTNIECHPKYDNKPKRFYLESESASGKAKRIVSQLKKKSRE